CPGLRHPCRLTTFPTRRSSDLSEPLPSDYTWVIETFGGMSPGPVLSVSPDRRYVAFLGQIGLEQQSMSQRELELFSYDTGSQQIDRKSTRLNSSHVKISYAVFC